MAVERTKIREALTAIWARLSPNEEVLAECILAISSTAVVDKAAQATQQGALERDETQRKLDASAVEAPGQVFDAISTTPGAMREDVPNEEPEVRSGEVAPKAKAKATKSAAKKSAAKPPAKKSAAKKSTAKKATAKPSPAKKPAAKPAPKPAPANLTSVSSGRTSTATSTAARKP